ncbi:hypothetical protein GBF35_44135 [Nonomuraea phyllanthi]|uniref:hypothetical protein n=1 Tax=Nonomuraea phyllanthi TaxID=2219224 RepID=UPI00129304A5|nr:hypothetical protein [Nonomuraea phyllanthi]QFY12642.1 hypothetical protein GBF35_44135 [Nonomuraea phyllanthi]
MPKLKSVMAGLAISTALGGGVVATGAMTSAANAGTAQVTTGTSVLAGGHCGWRRCGWGWGGRRHHRRENVRVFVHNNNVNLNRDRDNRREFRQDIFKRDNDHHRHHGLGGLFGEDFD